MMQNLFFFFYRNNKVVFKPFVFATSKISQNFKYGCENQPEKKLPVEVRHINNIHVDNVNQAKPR